jgi:ATP-dependent DNA helicase DinG
MLDAANILSELEDGGAVSKKLDHYEPREAQLGLMRLVIDAFNEDALCAAEAGTGVGKSFAYLLPALAFAAQSNERVVISTATITLQHQLFEKDIPFVTEALGLKIKTALVKGRANYLCHRRLQDEFRESQNYLDLNEKESIKKIMEWAEETQSGDRSELPFLPGGALWARIASDGDTCLGARCFFRESCFFMARRREALDARILVVNHYLLFADIAARNDGAGYSAAVVLPPYHRIIIDEAHTIEDAATNFLSSELSSPALYHTLGRLLRKKGARKSGLMLKISAFAGSGEDKTGEWLDAIDSIRSASAKLDAAALELCGKESVFRFIVQRKNLISSYLEAPLAALRETLMRFSSQILELIASLEKKYPKEENENNEGTASETDSLLRESRALTLRLTSAADLCAAFIAFEGYVDDVFWVERRSPQKGGDYAQWIRAPMDISSKLNAALFQRFKTVICVSATLTIAERFDYWMRRSGIALARDEDNNKRQIKTGCFPSPFPYKRAVLLASAVDAPLPEEARFRNFINNAVEALVLKAYGSALILFTSFEALESCYKHTAPALGAKKIRCLKQGDDDRSRLLRVFIEDESSVLFATDSFWEGVDAPGNTLRLVVLCRLPFRTPNDPVFEARREAVERAGGNPFMEISIPEAVIKFKQGFGRLMRRSSDRGVVAVLDSRIIKKRYGEVFIRSLPETKTCFAPFSELLDIAERFLEA